MKVFSSSQSCPAATRAPTRAATEDDCLLEALAAAQWARAQAEADYGAAESRMIEARRAERQLMSVWYAKASAQ